MLTATTDPRSAKLEFLKRRARRDPNKFTELMMKDETGLRVRQHKIHSNLQRFISDNDRGVILLPREHGKTTQLLSRSVWEIGHNHNIRAKVVSSGDRVAIARGKAMRELVSTDTYMDIFPGVSQGREWSDQKFTVDRETITPESTIECYGINSHAIGGRSDFMLFDDPDDEEVVVSEAKRKRNWERVSNVWLPLLAPNARAYILCTPWHQLDVAHRLMKQGWPIYKVAIKKMKPVWPERWNVEKLKDKLVDLGSMAFGRGYHLKVLSDADAPIKREWFRFWIELPPIVGVGIVVDPAIDEKRSSDYTAVGMLGVTRGNEVHLIEAIRRRMDFPTTLRVVEAMANRAEARFKMRPFLGFEDNAYQRALPQQMKRTTRFPIIGLTASKSKFIRASRFAVHVENGRVLLQAGKGQGEPHPDQQMVFDECVEFPTAEHDDCVDMMAHGVEMMLTLAGRPRPAAVGR